MNGYELGAALRAGHRVYGTCVISPAPQWPKMIAGTGLDFVFLDTEHIVLDRTELSWMCQAYCGLGLAPIVTGRSWSPPICWGCCPGLALNTLNPNSMRLNKCGQWYKSGGRG